MLLEELTTLRQAGLDELTKISDSASLEEWRVKYIGRKGQLTTLMRRLSEVPTNERREAGEFSNAVKQALTEAFNARQGELSPTKNVGRTTLDTTLPGRKINKGTLHISTLVINEILDIFNQLGFTTLEGPEVECEEYNFDKLNIPPDHPARDDMDTLWVESDQPLLLRTHTSPMQVRAMQQQDPPIRVVVPGKCFRYEATDASHDWQFHQIEGLAIGKGITMANMKWAFEQFARRMFGGDRKIRLRCDFFPFVEPGVDVSVDCFICSGNGCRLCKQTGWIEIMGAGMTHPNVLKAVGYDPNIVSGFAFGMGPERIAMLKYGIDDIRLFFENDFRFLRQFE